MYKIRETEGVIIKNLLKLKPGALIKLKKDRRFRKGHIKVTGTELRGDVEYAELITQPNNNK